MSYLRYLCLLAYNAQHILRCDFALFVYVLCTLYVTSFSALSIFDCPFVLCTLCYQFLCIVHF